MGEKPFPHFLSALLLIWFSCASCPPASLPQKVDYCLIWSLFTDVIINLLRSVAADLLSVI